MMKSFLANHPHTSLSWPSRGRSPGYYCLFRRVYYYSILAVFSPPFMDLVFVRALCPSKYPLQSVWHCARR
jgi:hypothetical protein